MQITFKPSAVRQPVSSAVHLEELRHARAELKRLEEAFDSHRGPESEQLRMQIRLVEQRVSEIRSALTKLPDPVVDC